MDGSELGNGLLVWPTDRPADPAQPTPLRSSPVDELVLSTRMMRTRERVNVGSNLAAIYEQYRGKLREQVLGSCKIIMRVYENPSVLMFMSCF